MKGGGGAIGYILGTIIIVPLLLYLISIIFLARKVTEVQINSYINNSEERIDSVEMISWDSMQSSNHKLGPQVKDITIYLSTHGKGRRQYNGYVYYSKKYNKYFNILVIVEGGGIDDAAVGNNIVMTVNKEDFNNPAYGTIDNPVPVLKFIGVNESIRYNNKDYDKAYMDTVFHDNVKIYLEYIMPKKEFKARYGN